MTRTGESYPPDFLDAIEARAIGGWAGSVWRHMFNDNPPELENRKGARWNPPDLGAVYTSLTREAALSEAEYLISQQPFRPKARRYMYELKLSVDPVVDLSSPGVLEGLGVGRTGVEPPGVEECRRIGDAVAWLNYAGLLVPSYRSIGTNLVIFPVHLEADWEMTVLTKTEIAS